MSSDLIKCVRCKKEKDLTLFMKNNVKLKKCFRCREMERLNKIKNKCPHGKHRFRCVNCDGSGICIHKKRKSYCVECGGNNICIHKKLKHQCKICGDKLKITIKNMIHHSREKDKKINNMVQCSKQSDKKHNRFNKSEFIDKPFLENLIKESNLICYYPFCKKKLNLDKANSALASIERLDNTIGHIKSNCVICCLECNSKRVSNKFN